MLHLVKYELLFTTRLVEKEKTTNKPNYLDFMSK